MSWFIWNLFMLHFGGSLQLCSQFQRQLSLYILPPMRSPEVPIFNKTRMECKKFLASSSFFCFWVSEKSWCQRDVVAFSGKQALYYHALKASRSPPHICTCATVHAWLWQKISLETAAALEVEGRQTLCFLFTTEAQCWKISKIDSSKKMLSFFKYCSKQLILVLIFGGKNSNFEKVNKASLVTLESETFLLIFKHCASPPKNWWNRQWKMVDAFFMLLLRRCCFLLSFCTSSSFPILFWVVVGFCIFFFSAGKSW